MLAAKFVPVLCALGVSFSLPFSNTSFLACSTNDYQGEPTQNHRLAGKSAVFGLN